ncbi:MAG: GC-type dockerin domain-anchored protein [Planctomycetota bacterium]
MITKFACALAALCVSSVMADDRLLTQLILPEECLVDSPSYGNDLAAADGVLMVAVRNAIRDGEEIIGLVEEHRRDADGRWWKVQDILPPPDLVKAQRFPTEIDFDGDRLVIGMVGVVESEVLVMRRDGDEWALEARISAPDVAGWDFLGRFGSNVAIDGDVLVITDVSASPPDWFSINGALLIYRFVGGEWILDRLEPAPSADAETSFLAIDVSGPVVAASIGDEFDLQAGLRVYNVDSGMMQEIRDSDQQYASIAIDGGLLAARAERERGTPSGCGEVRIYRLGMDSLFELEDSVEHACEVGFTGDQGRRLVVSDGLIALNGSVDRRDGSMDTRVGTFDLIERVDGAWKLSDSFFVSPAGSYFVAVSDKVGGLAIDGDQAILSAQWRGSTPVADCDPRHRGAVYTYDISPDYCAVDLDRDGRITMFDFLAFANEFERASPAADFEWDGDYTLADYLAFVNAFDAGCP